MYILKYNVIRTNLYIVMHASRGDVVLQSDYHVATKWIPEHVYTTKIQYIYKTHQYNKKIGKLRVKEELAFIEMIKGGKDIWI